MASTSLIPQAAQREVPASENALGRATFRTALVAGIFCLVVCLALFQMFLRIRAEDLLKSPELAALKEKLLATPKDEQLKSQIRILDLHLRERHFRRLHLNQTGAWLAMGGAIIFLLAAKYSLGFQVRLPMPQPNPAAAEQQIRAVAWSRWSVAILGIVAGLGFVSFAFTAKTNLPADRSGVEPLLGSGSKASGGLADFASMAEMQQNWPRFRGPDGSGISTQTNLPLTWDAKNGAGIVWKSEISSPGFNSPIVWGDHVFLSGGDAARREVLCFDAKKGALLWHQSPQNIIGNSATLPKVPEQTGYAASTMATDGRRVYAIFANGDLAAYALDGKQAWATNLAPVKNPHGHATSLLTWQGKLLVQLDQGETEQRASKLYAFDGATGRIVWQSARPVPTSWATPILIDVAGKMQVVTLGVPWVIAYSVKDGTELWRTDGLANEVTPSPIFAGGLVYAVSPNEKLMAIRPDGQGDVTKSHVVWTAEDNIPDISSPVSNGELVFTVSTPGVLTCYDAKDGKKQWEQDLAMEINASPSLAGLRLYLFGTKGGAVIVEAARQFKEIARCDLGEKVYASPAFAQNKIFVRGVQHLFCIGTTEDLSAQNH